MELAFGPLEEERAHLRAFSAAPVRLKIFLMSVDLPLMCSYLCSASCSLLVPVLLRICECSCLDARLNARHALPVSMVEYVVYECHVLTDGGQVRYSWASP